MSTKLDNTYSLNAVVLRRGFAMGLMVACSVVISFGGLIIRNMEDADAWQLNFYRSVAFIGAISVILVFQYRQSTVSYVKPPSYAPLCSTVSGAGGFMLRA